MTTERCYRCNLCHDAIAEYAGAECQSGQRAGVGCYFSGNLHKFVHMRDAEHHLCQVCIETICENARKMKIGQ